MRGRPKLSTEEKTKRGTLKKSREKLPPAVELEPKFVVAEMEPPKKLGTHATAVWRKTIPELKQNGLLAVIDVDILVAYCCEMGRYNYAIQVMEKRPPVFKSKSGHEQVDPWFTVAQKSIDMALKIGQNFGITPAARTKVGGMVPKKKTVADMLKGKTG